MDKRNKQEPGCNAAPDNHNGNGKRKGPRHHRAAQDALNSGNQKLIEQIRQIIAETPEIRPEKVGPLQEAVEQGAYRIDVRKLADILITKCLSVINLTFIK
jgi:anti-sigma28 factor (negative regulator of flagellin synthesis)